MTTTSLSPRGPGVTRLLRSEFMAKGSPAAAIAYAEAQSWMNGRQVVAALSKKAATGALTTDNSGIPPSSIAVEFVELMRPMTIIGRLIGLRRVAFNVRMVGQTVHTSAGWVGEGKRAPISSAAFAEGDVIGLRKLVATTVVSPEALASSDPNLERLLSSDLAKAAAHAEDVALADGNAGDENRPASISYGAPSFESSGSTPEEISDDLSLLIESLVDNGSDLAAAVFLMPVTTAVRLANMRTTGGTAAFPLLGARGGSIAGLPVLTSGNVPLSGDPATTTITLLDADGVLYADDGDADLDIAKHASLLMSDDLSDPAVVASMVSLYQANLTALRVTRFANWMPRRPGVAAVLTGVSF